MLLSAAGLQVRLGFMVVVSVTSSAVSSAAAGASLRDLLLKLQQLRCSMGCSFDQQTDRIKIGEYL